MSTFETSIEHNYAGGARGRLGGILLLTAVAVPLLLAVGHYVWKQKHAARYDAHSYCELHTVAPAETVILVDRTDRLTERHAFALHREIEALADISNPAIPVRGRVSFQAIDGQTRGLVRPVDSFCRPPLHSDESASGATEKRLRPTYEHYVERIRESGKAVESITPESDASPLFEAIRAIGQDAEFGAVKGPRRLIVVSDLLQNMPGYLSEPNNVHLDLKRLLATNYGQDTRADLRGVKVTIVYLLRQRAAELQSVQHERFWRAWFGAMGAEVIDFKRIPE